MSARRAGAGRAGVSTEGIRTHLTSLPPGELVDLLIEQVGHDAPLRERLLIAAAGKGPTATTAAALRIALDDAVGSWAFEEDGEGAGTVSSALTEVTARLNILLREGQALTVVEVAAYGLTEAKGAFEYVDDHWGYLSIAVEELASLHLRACRKARPDPVGLAAWLFAEHSNDDRGSCVDSVSAYKRVLGKVGIAEYRRLAALEWAGVPAVCPGQERQSSQHSGITRIMVDLVQAVGDTDELVDVLSRDLGGSSAYLRIAEILRSAQRSSEALMWAEAGVREFPAHTEARLREFLASAYHDLGRHPEAMALVWARFREHQDLTGYQGLKAHAERADSWPFWRDKALTSMCTTKPSRTERVHSELVRVFLWEGDPEAAWQAAEAGGCHESLWLVLAGRCERTHADEALAIYQRHIELLLAQRNDLAYGEAVLLLQRIRVLLKRLRRTQDFKDYLSTVRALHKPKRNFIKRLDAAIW